MNYSIGKYLSELLKSKLFFEIDTRKRLRLDTKAGKSALTDARKTRTVANSLNVGYNQQT